MRALRKAGLDIDVFVIGALEDELWRYSHELLDAGMPREQIHHLGIGESLPQATGMLGRRPAGLRDAASIMLSALRFGPATTAKTAYVMPKAWAWAAEHGDRYD